MKATIDELCECGRERRAICPACGRYVRLVGGKLAVHEIPHCMGSHIEYKPCARSGKLAVSTKGG